MAQAVVHDEWLKEEVFDPWRNTRRVVEALDDYRAHGVLAISVSLQGANQAYQLTPNDWRTRDAVAGPEKGALMSAYRADRFFESERFDWPRHGSPWRRARACRRDGCTPVQKGAPISEWGCMPWRQLQIRPFRCCRPGAAAKFDDAMETGVRDLAYFRTVLEHIRARIFRAR